MTTGTFAADIFKSDGIIEVAQICDALKQKILLAAGDPVELHPAVLKGQYYTPLGQNYEKYRLEEGGKRLAGSPGNGTRMVTDQNGFTRI